MAQPARLFRDYLERAIARDDEANRTTTSMGTDCIHTWLRNQGEDEANRDANELLNMIWRHGDPAENHPSSRMERWHYPGSRDDLFCAYIESTLARAEEASWLHAEAQADSLRKRQRDYDEHEDLEYEKELITKIRRYEEPRPRAEQ